MSDYIHYPVYFTTIKMKSLTLLAILFYLIAIHMKSLRRLTILLYFTAF